jgi:hypothetical protein
MRKTLLFICLYARSIPAFNQTGDSVLLSKRGLKILPEKGDIAIGIDAVPFLNMFNEKGTSPGFNFVNNFPVFSLKFFNTDNSAIRMKFLIGYSSGKDGDTDFKQYDKTTTTSIGINMGFEKRFGKSRVQGFYGIQGGVGYGKSKEVNDRDIVSLETSNFSIGASIFLGAEFFVAPKLSIGGEFTWGPQYVIEKDIQGKTATSAFAIGADNAYGALILAFHF